MRNRHLLLAALLSASLAGCDKGGSKSDSPDGTTAALPAKEEGERLDKVRAALRYQRGAELRGKLAWRERDGDRRPALIWMYLQGSEDLGELTLEREGPKRVRGSITILARGGGATSKCKLQLSIGDRVQTVRHQYTRNATPPSELRVEVDALEFEIDLNLLRELASTADSGGSACGLSFSFTRSQRDRLDRMVTLFAGAADEAAFEATKAGWDSDRLPSDDGGFRELGAELGASTPE